MNIQGRRTQKAITVCFFGCVFLFFYILYTRITPLVIFDMDDWYFLVYRRSLPFPTPGGSNPIRVLPEYLMPLTAELSTLTIFPFTYEFLGSIEQGMAIVISALVTVYAYAFYRMTRKKIQVTAFSGMALTVFFLLLHFLVFRTLKHHNDFLLNGHNDTTTFFFYLVPAVWNAALVMVFMTDGFFRPGFGVKKTALLIPAVYLAVFSNLHQSIILAAYVLTEAVFHFIQNKKIKPVIPHLVFLTVWLVSLGMETTGGRAGTIGINSAEAFFSNLQSCLGLFIERITNVNTVFVIILGLAITVSVTTWILSKRKKEAYPAETQYGGLKTAAIIALVLIFLFLLCSASAPSYIQRGDVLLSALFFLFVFICNTLARLSKEKKAVRTAIPILLLICFLMIPTAGDTLKKSISSDVPYQTAKTISQDIVDQITEADEEHKAKITIAVPRFGSDDNWPLTQNGTRISEVLYKYHLITRKVKATLEPNSDLNPQYGLE